MLWYLNAVCVQDGGPGNPVTSVAATPAAGFSLDAVQDAVWHRFVDARYRCNVTTGVFERRPAELPAPPVRAPSTAPRPKDACARPVPTGNPPAFGAPSFSLYTAALLIAVAAWGWHSLPDIPLHDSGGPPRAQADEAERRRRQGRVRALLAAAQIIAATMLLAASGLLARGMDAAARPPFAPDDGGGPAIARNFTGLAVVWCAAACGAAACAAYVAGFCLWRAAAGPAAPSARPGPRAGMAARARARALGLGIGAAAATGWRGSLPTYRPRDADDDMDELPPYQREDPLGSPPHIDNRHYVAASPPAAPPSSAAGSSTLGAASSSTGAGASTGGRQTPSPEYAETEAGGAAPAMREPVVYAPAPLGGRGRTGWRLSAPWVELPPSEASGSGRSTPRSASSAGSASLRDDGASSTVALVVRADGEDGPGWRDGRGRRSGGS